MGTFYTLPRDALAGGVCASAASAWGFGSWVLLQEKTEEITILGASYQWTSIPGLDTTESHLIEIGTGAAGAESVKLQFASNHRPDTQVGYYLKTIPVFLPEPFVVTAGTRIAVRAADSSTSARTYQGFRLLIDRITPGPPGPPNPRINQAVNRKAAW